MTRPELIVCSMLLIAVIVGLRWALLAVNDNWGIGALAMTCGLGFALVLTCAYVVERRRGNLPRWLRPRDQG